MLHLGRRRTTKQAVPWWKSLLILGLVLAPELAAAAEEPAETAVLNGMKAQIKTVKVAVESKPTAKPATLRPEPVFRYSDAVRDFPDATIWVWEVDHQPVAICKLERVGTPGLGWQFCFASISDQIVTANWSDRFEWRAREAGVRWKSVSDAPAPRETEASRLIQMRQLARPFSGVIRNPKTQGQEMRLLPTPILRYGEAKSDVHDGAVFGLTSNGTNPDMLLLLQTTKSAAGKDEWQYGLHGMTGDEVEIQLQDKVVHKQPYTGRPGNHGTWMWIVFYDDGGVAP